MNTLARRRHRRVLVAAIVATLALVACGSDSDEPAGGSGEASPSSQEFPTTIDTANGPLTIEEEPAAIVSLSPTATEILFAIGAGDQVEAVDDQSNYPAEAPMTKLSGFEPNVEAIAAYEPDLVVFATDPGDLAQSLDKVAIPNLQQDAAADLDGTYEQIEELGAATGHADEASALIESMKADIEATLAEVGELDSPPTYYHELDPTLFTATSATFIGEIYSLLGLENIGDEAPKAGSGYVQLSAEYVIDADPDLIFLADTICCKQDADSVAKRPGWDELTAVQEGHVVEMSDDIASRWGPRIVEFLQDAAEAVKAL